MSKILVIDDDKELCSLIKKYAEQEQYTVEVSHTGAAGLREVHKDTFQLIILVIMCCMSLLIRNCIFILINCGINKTRTLRNFTNQQ